MLECVETNRCIPQGYRLVFLVSFLSKCYDVGMSRYILFAMAVIYRQILNAPFLPPPPPQFHLFSCSFREMFSKK